MSRSTGRMRSARALPNAWLRLSVRRSRKVRTQDRPLQGFIDVMRTPAASLLACIADSADGAERGPAMSMTLQIACEMRNCAAVSPRPTSVIVLTLLTLRLSSLAFGTRSCLLLARVLLLLVRVSAFGAPQTHTQKPNTNTNCALLFMHYFYFIFIFFNVNGSPPLCSLNCSQRLLMTPTAASGICMIYLLRKCCTLQRTCAALRYRFALLYKMCNKISAKKLFCIKIPCAASTATGRE